VVSKPLPKRDLRVKRRTESTRHLVKGMVKTSGGETKKKASGPRRPAKKVG